jgi:hypothetical protein
MDDDDDDEDDVRSVRRVLRTSLKSWTYFALRDSGISEVLFGS